MCKFCEKLTNDNKMDMHGLKHILPLPMSVYSSDIDINETENIACIVEPTPISMRRHKEDGLTSSINIYFADDKRRVSNFWIPIKYCPMCGKEII